MDHRIHQIPSASISFPNKVRPKQVKQHTHFQELLQDHGKLKLSKHATERMKQRDIQIPQQLWDTIGDKLQEARKKGIDDSLVILDNAALLASAKNNTIVTAMNREEARNRIFTNINGTILIDN